MPKEAINIDELKVCDLLFKGFNWKQIALQLTVSDSTLLRWRKSTLFPDFDEINPNDLDEMMYSLCIAQPRIGVGMAQGHFLSRGWLLTRQAVRNSMARLDPDGSLRLRRSRRRLKRKVYYSTGLHHAWHQDGNHKLKPIAGLIIHGCIDGLSRMIIYLRVADNNSALFVTQCFIEACRSFNTQPLQVVGDHGGENVGIARVQFAKRGEHARPKPYHATKSTNNQRMERCWRDINDTVSIRFVELFRHWSSLYDLDSSNPLHIWTLQFMFIPLIQDHLDRFKSMWNHHKIRTEHRQSPVKIAARHANTAPPPILLDGEHQDPSDEARGWVREGDDEMIGEGARQYSQPCPLQLQETYDAFIDQVQPLRIDEDGDDDHLYERYVNGIAAINVLYEYERSVI